MSTPTIPVRGEIKLGQFVKLASLAEDGAQARELSQAGDVTVNGEVETRRIRLLSTPVDDASRVPPGPGSHHVRTR